MSQDLRSRKSTMADSQRHEREVQATLKQIKAKQKKSPSARKTASAHPSQPQSSWHLDVPVWRLALEGIGVFVFAFLVGQGLATLFYVLTK